MRITPTTTLTEIDAALRRLAGDFHQATSCDDPLRAIVLLGHIDDLLDARLARTTVAA